MTQTDDAPDSPDGAPQDGPLPDAPTLPDAAPDAVQDLLDGVFGAINDGAGAVGDVASELAKAIGDAVGGGGGEEESVVAVLDVAADVALSLF